jgi:hypothetical protein
MVRRSLAKLLAKAGVQSKEGDPEKPVTLYRTVKVDGLLIFYSEAGLAAETLVEQK